MGDARSTGLATAFLAVFALAYWGGQLACGLVALAAMLWRSAF
jgi:hypothetical protein